jgi:hypothetical protein
MGLYNVGQDAQRYAQSRISFRSSRQEAQELARNSGDIFLKEYETMLSRFSPS